MYHTFTQNTIVKIQSIICSLEKCKISYVHSKWLWIWIIICSLETNLTYKVQPRPSGGRGRFTPPAVSSGDSDSDESTAPLAPQPPPSAPVWSAIDADDESSNSEEDYESDVTIYLDPEQSSGSETEDDNRPDDGPSPPRPRLDGGRHVPPPAVRPPRPLAPEFELQNVGPVRPPPAGVGEPFYNYGARVVNPELQQQQQQQQQQLQPPQLPQLQQLQQPLLPQQQQPPPPDGDRVQLDPQDRPIRDQMRELLRYFHNLWCISYNSKLNNE